MLLGTNILNSLIDNVTKTYGERHLQLSNFTTPWYLKFRAMHLTDRGLRRNNFRIGLVRSAENGIIRIPPYTNIIIQGYIAHTYTILTAPKSSIPDIDIEPSLFGFNNYVSEVDIHLSNITT